MIWSDYSGGTYNARKLTRACVSTGSVICSPSLPVLQSGVFYTYCNYYVSRNKIYVLLCKGLFMLLQPFR